MSSLECSPYWPKNCWFLTTRVLSISRQAYHEIPVTCILWNKRWWGFYLKFSCHLSNMSSSYFDSLIGEKTIAVVQNTWLLLTYLLVKFLEKRDGFQDTFWTFTGMNNSLLRKSGEDSWSGGPGAIEICWPLVW